MFGTQGAGQFFSYAPDILKAMSATMRITRLLEHPPDIDVSSKEGKPIKQLGSGLKWLKRGSNWLKPV